MSRRIHDTPQDAARERKRRLRETQRLEREAAERLCPKVDPDVAFASHEWEDIDGEARCICCMTATTWPLAEQMCTGTRPCAAERRQLLGTPKTRRERRPQMTPAEIQQAVEWRRDERSLKWIGLRLSRSKKTVADAVKRVLAEAERERGAA